jgi:hypothetical protein
MTVSACSTAFRVSGAASPTCRSRRERDTALIACGTATLARRTPPSPGASGGRSWDTCAVALIGITTNKSRSLPVCSASTETMIAGRFFPGPPGVVEPSRTSQTCPRDGSVDSVANGEVPVVLLRDGLRHRSVAERRGTL